MERKRLSALKWWLIPLVGVAGLLLYQRLQPSGPPIKQVAYSELRQAVDEGRVREVEIADALLTAKLSGEGGAEEVWKAVRLPGVREDDLVALLREKKVKFAGRIEAGRDWVSVLVGWVLPLLLLLGLPWLMMRRAGAGGRGALTFGKNKARVQDKSTVEKVTFADVAGVDEAEQELVEVVEFLKNPDKYRRLGARIPRGVLLLGPPGTGKTLLARAVAGEAQVPFFSISASEFVEMFVGVGAARVRDLFEQAKTRAPCIVFIDEIDAIGKTRGGVGAMATHDEREQTLNQLLAEMDGFDGSTGVIIMAATNRPEVLDPALLRAGRFDRQVLVDRPDLKGRQEILEVHARRVKLKAEVSLRLVAQRTPGMVGADLANVVNEAALAAARRGGAEVTDHDFDEAIDRIQLGLQKRGRVMREDEKRRVAVHECGHTLVALSLKHADPVQKVSIIPRSIGALGVTLQLPEEDRYLLTKEELKDRICVLMGGRAAEELVCGDVSSGAENDFEHATELARRMVTRFGMSDELGPGTFGRSLGARFLAGPLSLGEERNYSEETARRIDQELSNILTQQRARAHEVLTRRRPALDLLTHKLLESETLDRDEVSQVLQQAEGKDSAA